MTKQFRLDIVGRRRRQATAVRWVVALRGRPAGRGVGSKALESDPRFHSIARAIGALTAWLQTDTDPEFLAQEITRTAEEGVEAASELTAGLVNVAGILLVQLEHVEQRPALEILQDLAQRYPAA